MAKQGQRVIIRLRSTESPYTYSTTKSKRNNPDRLQIMKYDPIVNKHVLFKEQR
jgi:large subunit ribosomal protein L33